MKPPTFASLSEVLEHTILVEDRPAPIGRSDLKSTCEGARRLTLDHASGGSQDIVEHILGGSILVGNSAGHSRTRDPKTGRFIGQDSKWDMGHQPGFEFWKHKLSAIRRGLTRKMFLDEHNDPTHYRPELPSSNRGHSLEGDSIDGWDFD
jgi:hypothetical protein